MDDELQRRRRENEFDAMLDEVLGADPATLAPIDEETEASLNKLEVLLGSDAITLRRTLTDFMILVWKATKRLEELGDEELAPTLRETLYEKAGIAPPRNREEA